MSADGSTPVALTTFAGGDPYWSQPTWSPDGTKIAFGGLSVINADGSDLRSLTSNAVRPKWSPDGTKIAFTRDPFGSGEVYVINVDGSGLVNLTNNLGVGRLPILEATVGETPFILSRRARAGFV